MEKTFIKHGVKYSPESDPKPYYLPNSDNWDSFFGSESPVCIDREEAERLLYEWHGLPGTNDDMEFDDLWREADEDEIAEYGTYDS